VIGAGATVGGHGTETSTGLRAPSRPESQEGERAVLSGRRAIVADDHVVIRSGLTRILETELGMTVVALAATGEEVTAAVLEQPADVLVLDLGMPGSGISTIESVHALRPSLRILVYSMHAEREWAVRCLAAGASGYVNKSADISELTDAIRKVAAGRRHVSPDVAEQLVERAIGIDDEVATPPHERLSNREYEVFERLAAGMSTGEIATEFGLSPKTISTYRSRILEKLGVERNADLTRYAIRHGLMDL
jgi:two-component system, NarL family, invasion response regulator UvrY